MKKIFKCFIMIVALFVLTACSGGNNSNNDTGGGSEGEGGNSSNITYSITFSGEAANSFNDLGEFSSGQTYVLPFGDFLNTEDQSFYAWNDGTQDYFPNQQYTIIDKDVTFTAVYKPNLTVIVNGGYCNIMGNGHISDNKFKYGTEVEIVLEDDIPNNKKFLGWYSGENLMSTQTRFNHTLEANITFTPKFIDLYVITVKNGAVYEENDTTLSNNLVENGFFYAEKDKSYRLVASKEADDVNFHGWKTSGYDRDGYNYLRYTHNGRNERVKKNQLVQFTKNITLEAIYDGKSKSSLVFTNYDCPTNVYPVGYEIDYSKMFIDVTLYNDEVIRNINVTPSMVTNFTTDTEGKRYMEISYTYNGETISEDIYYEVYASLASNTLELSGELEKSVYAINNANVSLKGLVIKAKFTIDSVNNTTEWRDVSSKVSLALKDGEDISTSGDKIYVITYSYDGKDITEEITFTYTDLTIEKPHNMALLIEDGKYYLTWEEVSNVSVDGYEIYKNGDQIELLATIPDTKYEIISLQDGDTYLVRSVIDELLYSEYSSITLDEQTYYDELNEIKYIYENKETSVFLETTFEYTDYPVSGIAQTYYDVSNAIMYSYKNYTEFGHKNEVKTYTKMLNSEWKLINEYDLVKNKTYSYLNDDGFINLNDLTFDHSNSFTLFFYEDSNSHLVDRDSIDLISKYTYLDSSLYTMTATGEYYDYVVKIYTLNNRIVKLVSEVYENNEKIGTVINTVTYKDYADNGIEHTFIEPEKIDVKINKGTLYSYYEGYVAPYKEEEGYLFYKLYKGDNALVIPEYRGKYYRPDEILGLNLWVPLSMTTNHDTGNLRENAVLRVLYDVAIKLEGNAIIDPGNNSNNSSQTIIDNETYYLVSETLELSLLSKLYESGEDPMGYIAYWEINGSSEIDDEIVEGTPSNSGKLKVNPKPGYVYKSYNTYGKMVNFTLGEDVTADFGRIEINNDYFIGESYNHSGNLQYEYGYHINLHAPMIKEENSRKYGFVRFVVQKSSVAAPPTFDNYDNDVIFKYKHSISYRIIAEYKDITDLVIEVEMEEGFELQNLISGEPIEYGDMVCINIEKDLNPGEWIEFEDENGNKYYPGEWFNIYEPLTLTSKVINETPTGITMYNTPMFEVGSSYNSNKVKVMYIYPHANSAVYTVTQSNVTGFSTSTEGIFTMNVSYGGFTVSTAYIVAEYYTVTIDDELCIDEVQYDIYTDNHYNWALSREIELDPEQKTIRVPKDSTFIYRTIEEDEYKYMYSVVNYPNSGSYESSPSCSIYISEDNITIDVILADTVELVVDLIETGWNKDGVVDYFVNDPRVFFNRDDSHWPNIPRIYIVQRNTTYSEQPYEISWEIELQENMITNFDITTPTDTVKTATITYDGYTATFGYRIIDPTKKVQISVDSPYDVEYQYLDAETMEYVVGNLQTGMVIPYYAEIYFDTYSYEDPYEKIVYSAHLGGKNETIQIYDAYDYYVGGINLRDYLGEVTTINITYEFVKDTIDPDRDAMIYHDYSGELGRIFYDYEDMTKYDVSLVNLRVFIYFETFSRTYYVSNDEFEIISLSRSDDPNYMDITYKITVEAYDIVIEIATNFYWYY